MSGEVFGVATVALAMLIGVLQLLADNRGRLRRELAAGIVRKEWRMEERHNGVFMIHAKRGEVLRLVDYEARIEAGSRLAGPAWPKESYNPPPPSWEPRPNPPPPPPRPWR